MAKAKKPTNDRPQESIGERFGELLHEWRIAVSHLLDEAETFTREKPGLGLASAFFLGLFLGRWFRRR